MCKTCVYVKTKIEVMHVRERKRVHMKGGREEKEGGDYAIVLSFQKLKIIIRKKRMSQTSTPVRTHP